MQDDTKVEDPSRNHQSRAATDGVGQERGHESTEESTGGEDRHDRGFLGGGDIGVSLGVDVAGTEQTLPVRHREDAADGPRVISASMKSD